MNQAEKIKKIADHFGLESQMSMLEEECAELIQAISKLRRVGIDDPHGAQYIAARSNVTEEMADVLNLIYQMEYLLQGDLLADFWLEHKLNRTLKRIEEGRYAASQDT